MQKTNILQPDLHREQLRKTKSDLMDDAAQRTLKWMFKEKSYFKRYLKYMIILLLADLLENFISGYTSFSYIHNLTSGFMDPSIAWYLSIISLCIFETAKILVYVQFFMEFFNKNAGFNLGLFLSALLLTALSFFFSWKGSHAVVYHNYSPPVLVQASEIENFYQSEIAAKRESINFLKSNSAGSIKWKVNAQVTELENQVEQLNQELKAHMESRETNNEGILLRHDQTKKFTRDDVRKISIVFNLLSFFFFAPILGNFIVTSALDYDKRNSGDAQQIIAEKDKENQTFTPKTTEKSEKAEAKRNDQNSNDHGTLNGVELNGNGKKS